MNNSETGIGETHTNLAIRQTVVAGAAAGPIAVPGWMEGNSLKSVVNLTDGTDVTDEFTEDGADGIDNTGGTATTGDTLLVLYIERHPSGDSLTRS